MSRQWLVIAYLLGPVWLSSVTLGDLASDKQGPYVIEMKYIEDCADVTTALVKSYPKMKKTTRTTILVEGMIVMNITMDNNIKVIMNFGQSTPQGWKDNFYITDFKGKGVCDVMSEYLKPEDALKIFEGLVSDSKNYTGCPIDPGVYKVNEINIKVTEFKGFPVFFYGKYRSQVTLYQNDHSGPPIGCIYFYADFVPKRTKKKKG